MYILKTFIMIINILNENYLYIKINLGYYRIIMLHKYTLLDISNK